MLMANGLVILFISIEVTGIFCWTYGQRNSNDFNKKDDAVFY
jgi:hypothetical protein